MNWYVFWAVWVVAGIAAELIAVGRGSKNDTLTEFKRRFVLGSPIFSSLIGALLCWLLWHWLLVADGVGFGDLIAIVVGIGIGLTGWVLRTHEG
jgi:hypothetical protein